MNVEEKHIEANRTEEAWLIFKLMKQTFAVNCHDVIGILRSPSEVTHMSGYSGHVRGVMDYRGTTLPLLELRSVLGMISFEQQHAEFNDMIDARIGDHRRWVQEFERCITEGDEFKLATDPHKCAFGKWYYGFETDNQSISFDLKKIEEPHKKLHELATHMEQLQRVDDDETRATGEKEIVRKAKSEYMPKVIGLLEDLEEIFREGYREMCIVLSNDQGKMMGLLADEVSVVEKLTAVDSQGLFDSAFSSSGISHTARSQSIDGEVFVLNREDLFKCLF